MSPPPGTSLLRSAPQDGASPRTPDRAGRLEAHPATVAISQLSIFSLNSRKPSSGVLWRRRSKPATQSTRRAALFILPELTPPELATPPQVCADPRLGNPTCLRGQPVKTEHHAERCGRCVSRDVQSPRCVQRHCGLRPGTGAREHQARPALPGLHGEQRGPTHIPLSSASSARQLPLRAMLPGTRRQ